MDFKQLAALFPQSDIFWKIGTTNEDKTFARAVPYIDARAVQARLDEVATPAGWSCSFSEIIANNRLIAVRCSIGIYDGKQWIHKEDAAHLDASARLEIGVKGAYSDALKRAAVQWGIGRYLYAFVAPIVPIHNNKFLSMPQLPESMILTGDTSTAKASIATIVAGDALPENVPATTTQVNTANAESEESPGIHVAMESEHPLEVSGATVETKTPVSAESTGNSVEDDIVPPMTDVESKLVSDIIAKAEAKKMSVETLITYVSGTKCAEKLSPPVVEYTLSKLKGMTTEQA